MRQLENAGVLAPAPILYGIAFVTGVFLALQQPALLLATPASTAIGLPVLLVGGFIAVWANRTLRSAGTSANPFLSSRRLVVTGPFRFSRNPLYLARTLLYVGLALTMNTLGPLLMLGPLWVFLHYGVIRREERYMDGKFGSAYKDYRARVRRWL